MQNDLYDQVNNLYKVLKSIENVQVDEKPVLRSDERMTENFAKCGWLVKFDSTQKVWAMDRLSYADWKKRGYGSAETNKAFNGLQGKLETLTNTANVFASMEW
jgi:hypothetical protein